MLIQVYAQKKKHIEHSIYCGIINSVGSYIHLTLFHPFQQVFIYIDNFFPFLINLSSNLSTLYNVEKIVWPTVYAVFSIVWTLNNSPWVLPVPDPFAGRVQNARVLFVSPEFLPPSFSVYRARQGVVRSSELRNLPFTSSISFVIVLAVWCLALHIVVFFHRRQLS
jgi:hypothetical protein